MLPSGYSQRAEKSTRLLLNNSLLVARVGVRALSCLSENQLILSISDRYKDISLHRFENVSDYRKLYVDTQRTAKQ